MVQKEILNKKMGENQILVVDDNLSNLTTVKTVLSEEGYRDILTVSSGREALSIAKEKKPDLVILDIMMPEMDGFEVCSTLKGEGETSDIPVIMLSARTSAKDMQRGFDVGAVNYVEKPFEADELVSRIESALNLKNQNKMMHKEAPETKQNLILVVDDNQSNLTAVKTVLSEEGYRNILTVSSGNEALSITKEKKPDLVILDIMMPEMDGFEVCSTLKGEGETSDIPVIMLSARTSPKDMQKGFDLGAVNYVEKPFEADELVSRIESALKLKKIDV